MKQALSTALPGLLVAATLVGCETAGHSSANGFLSDYSRLEPTEDGLRFIDVEAVANVERLILEPLQVFLYGGEQLEDVDQDELDRLTAYLDTAIRAALVDRYEIVAEPAPGVARLRIAMTNIDRSTPVLDVLPPEQLGGIRVGIASMEAELIDARTGRQIGAVVEAQKTTRLTLAGVDDKWEDAESVMDGWAARLRQRLDEARGN